MRGVFYACDLRYSGGDGRRTNADARPGKWISGAKSGWRKKYCDVIWCYSLFYTFYDQQSVYKKMQPRENLWCFPAPASVCALTLRADARRGGIKNIALLCVSRCAAAEWGGGALWATVNQRRSHLLRLHDYWRAFIARFSVWQSWAPKRETTSESMRACI